jgi:hypothetical protein
MGRGIRAGDEEIRQRCSAEDRTCMQAKTDRVVLSVLSKAGTPVEDEITRSSARKSEDTETVTRRLSGGIVFDLQAYLPVLWRSSSRSSGAEAAPVALLAKGFIHSMRRAGASIGQGSVRLLRTAEQHLPMFSQVRAPEQRTGQQGVHCPSLPWTGDLTTVLRLYLRTVFFSIMGEQSWYSRKRNRTCVCETKGCVAIGHNRKLPI